MIDQRLLLLKNWLKIQFPQEDARIVSLAGDASFRRYFRIYHQENSLIAMDAPPEHEDCRPFIALAQAFAQNGILVPEILSSNLDLGFLLLSDFGDTLYLSELQPNRADQLYKNALEIIPKIQTCIHIPGYTLPLFGPELLDREWDLFIQWFLQRHLRLDQTPNDLLEKTRTLLYCIFQAQPQVCVHRDYHSRNLMYLPQEQIGVLDFQDAVLGPITYDAVSLLRDCYIHWPSQDVENWALFFHALMQEQYKKQISDQEFLWWFDAVGVQRHLKVLGIFSRLYHRDGKPGYLKDIPRVMNYVVQVCAQYKDLKPLAHFFETQIIPRFFEVTIPIAQSKLTLQERLELFDIKKHGDEIMASGPIGQEKF